MWKNTIQGEQGLTGAMNDLQLTELDNAAYEKIWQIGSSDGWLLRNPSKEAFLRYVGDMAIAEFTGEGFIKGVQIRGNIAGFVTMQQVAHHFLPDGVFAAECGTYLLPMFRGQNLNCPVKQALLRATFEITGAEWAIFAVDSANHRAIHAMERLPWSFEKETMQERGQFHAYCKRKCWESGSECILYSLSRLNFESC